MIEASQAVFKVKNLDTPDERRTPPHGELNVVHLPGATITQGILYPGWKWSTDIAPLVGTTSCQVAHTGVILSGQFHVRMDDGREYEFGPGDAHVVAPGHDAWVVGDETVEVIDFAATGQEASGSVGRCPCGVEFRVASDDQLDHLVAAIQQHAAGSHGHELARDVILAEVSAT